MFYSCVSARTVLTTREALIYLLQRHCAAVDALQQVVIITLVAGHWKNAALCQTGKQGRKAPVLWWNDPKQLEC